MEEIARKLYKILKELIASGDNEFTHTAYEGTNDVMMQGTELNAALDLLKDNQYLDKPMNKSEKKEGSVELEYYKVVAETQYNPQILRMELKDLISEIEQAEGI